MPILKWYLSDIRSVDDIACFFKSSFISSHLFSLSNMVEYLDVPHL